ncbi:cell division protein ZapE [Rhodococcoides trifolii]|uniref:Cell division protein ZapE n=1 Tax=Rhodococcoides trifolii TaxID=908250 RepID=A0A917LFY4_9NOCA|nr:cell division protein ZapE [Rhodococcus trifolii]GGG19051.1 cell division protein ZapE [Rhodococcus trifolii]
MDEGQQRVRDACAQVCPGRGLYVWGPVGRGKTMLLDEHFDTLREPKVRMHFHDFFVRLHAEFIRADLRIDRALDAVVGRAEAVLFDEFFVHDIGDAMLVHRGMQALKTKRVTVMATSNYAPDNLLPSNLFHAKFVPTIELLKSMMQIVDIGAGLDYRTKSDHKSGFAAGRWTTTGRIQAPAGKRTTLFPAGHPVVALFAGNGSVWFDFADLCEKATATSDYIALARTFPRWFVTGIPPLANVSQDSAIRFANVVDVLCDRDIETVFISDGPPDLRGLDRVPQFESARLASRLGQLLMD